MLAPHLFLQQYPHVVTVAERVHTASMALMLPALAGVSAVDLTSSTDPLASLVQYGVLGLVVLAFITGWIVPGPQAKQLVEENKRLNALIESKFLPMVEQYAGSQERTAIVMEKCTTALDRAIHALDAAEQRHLSERNRDRDDRGRDRDDRVRERDDRERDRGRAG